jgi:DNA-binding transcriptional MerR regulator
MSAQEIIAELSKLDRKELERVDAQLHELLGVAQRKKGAQKSLRETLLHFAGKAEGLPTDYSTNLDHYLYGLPKRRP